MATTKAKVERVERALKTQFPACLFRVERDARGEILSVTIERTPFTVRVKIQVDEGDFRPGVTKAAFDLLNGVRKVVREIVTMREATLFVNFAEEIR